jgi:REP element-mobilizing transposase RayT
MVYDPTKHHRRSIRLKGYDYSREGLYFITICVQNRDLLFGRIEETALNSRSEIFFNDAGKVIEKWYLELENKFPDIKCGVYVVMPNHFHCIIENNGKGNPSSSKKSSITPCVGADLRVCPDELNETEIVEMILSEHIGSPKQDSLRLDKTNLGEHIGSPLHHVIQWFKTMSTNEYIRGVKTLGWKRFDRKLWQRDYWEHIIRDQNSFDTISNYIINNPQNWNTDNLK